MVSAAATENLVGAVGAVESVGSVRPEDKCHVATPSREMGDAA